MINIRYEKGVSSSIGREITIAYFTENCPVCGEQKKADILFEKGKEDTPYVMTICHPELMEIMNKYLPKDFQLRKK